MPDGEGVQVGKGAYSGQRIRLDLALLGVYSRLMVIWITEQYTKLFNELEDKYDNSLSAIPYS